jgi:hypothetical protein
VTAAGGEASEEQVAKLFADLEGKDISSSGGGGAAPAGNY